MLAAAFKLCRDIQCPHPRFLFTEKYGITMGDLEDWLLFYLWENAPDERMSDAEKFQLLQDYREEYGEE